MVKAFYHILREVRPRQWVKNLTIFAAIFFTGELLNPNLFRISVLAFIAFCLASSSSYIINDLADMEKDRLHPLKKTRPVAAGEISKSTALALVVILTLTAYLVAWQISINFVFVLLIFYLLHLSYSFYFKNVILLDILVIAASFILRVFAGEIATGYHLDIWLFLTVISGALFLAIGKRRSELTLLSGLEGSIQTKTRATLSHYSERMLDVYISMFANSTWITYAFYTFLQRPPVLRKTVGNFFDQYNLDVLTERKWLMITIPLVIYAIMRYLQLIYEKNEGESPEKVLLSDKPLIFTAVLLGVILFGILYLIRKY